MTFFKGFKLVCASVRLDERKIQKVSKLKGELASIQSRSPFFECSSCKVALYREDFEFCFVCGTPVCMKL